jgi:hypothetical protein
MGVSGGLTGSANRIEKISIDLPLKKLKDVTEKSRKGKPYCDLDDWVPTVDIGSGETLTRNLGLDEWMDSTLGPMPSTLLQADQPEVNSFRREFVRSKVKPRRILQIYKS